MQLVVLCSPPPTLELVDRVAKTLRVHLKVYFIWHFNFEIRFYIIFFFKESVSWNKFTVESYPDKALVLVKATPNCGDIIMKIFLSSIAFRWKSFATTPSAGMRQKDFERPFANSHSF